MVGERAEIAAGRAHGRFAPDILYLCPHWSRSSWGMITAEWGPGGSWKRSCICVCLCMHVCVHRRRKMIFRMGARLHQVLPVDGGGGGGGGGGSLYPR